MDRRLGAGPGGKRRLARAERRARVPPGVAGRRAGAAAGGGALGAKLIADGLVDRLYWIQSPVWLGDGAIPAFPGVPDARIDKAPHWVPVERRALGPDTLLVLDRTLCLPAS